MTEEEAATPLEQDQSVVELTAAIVSAFVGHNAVRADDLPEVIKTVYRSLSGISAPPASEKPEPELKPSVPVKKSVTDDYIISLEDGRKFKSMRRYLAGLGMTPEQYREKWGLPRDYPMVAPAYAARRSELAKATGLGASRRQSESPATLVNSSAPAPAEKPHAAPEPDSPSAPPGNRPAPAGEEPLSLNPAPTKRRGRAKKAS